MDELQELIRQRNEINQKIKELKERSTIVGNARINYHTSVNIGYCKDEGWTVDILTINSHKNIKDFSKWTKVIVASSKEDALDNLNSLLNDLTILYEKETEEC